MKQLKPSMLCTYCLGCDKLEAESYAGTRQCKNFVPAYKDWQEKFYKAMKEEKKNDNS